MSITRGLITRAEYGLSMGHGAVSIAIPLFNMYSGSYLRFIRLQKKPPRASGHPDHKNTRHSSGHSVFLMCVTTVAAPKSSRP